MNIEICKKCKAKKNIYHLLDNKKYFLNCYYINNDDDMTLICSDIKLSKNQYKLIKNVSHTYSGFYMKYNVMDEECPPILTEDDKLRKCPFYIEHKLNDWNNK